MPYPSIRLAVFLLCVLVPGAAAAGDPVAGEEIHARCLGCHAIDYNRTGPKHAGLFDRSAGAVPEYRYSTAMRESGIVWSEETLDRFLEAPRDAVPGTRMTFAGVEDPDERADLIAYLKAATVISEGTAE